MADLFELFEDVTTTFCDVNFTLEKTDWDNLSWRTEDTIYLLND